MTGSKPINTLLVEDSPTQSMMVQCAVEEIAQLHLLESLSDGAEALKYLRREEPYQDAVRPDLILLDINMPKMDGYAVLKELKADEDLRSIPVVMLTSSDQEEDVAKSYQEGANSFISKPVETDELEDVLKQLATYFSKAARLPGNE